jgi:hypothetical protein
MPSGPERHAQAPLGERFCKSCTYYRPPEPVALFSAAELQSSTGHDAAQKWHEAEKEQAEREQAMFLQGEPFLVEPQHFAWCAKLTRIDLADAATHGDAVARKELLRLNAGLIDPVTGAAMPVYAICKRANPSANCQFHRLAD